MYLREVIDYLEACDPATRVPVGLGRPCSYRGSYDELAFEVARDTTVGAMLESARSALGQTFTGYKGGEFTMDGWSRCWLVADSSECGEGIGPVLLDYMTGKVASRPGQAPPAGEPTP